MATILPEARPDSAQEPERPDHEQHSPEVILLEDRLPEWFRSRPVVCGLAVLLAVVFVLFSSLRLAHTDLWGHLNYGRTIWNGRVIPTTEPSMSLAEGVRMVDTAWLSQLTAYGTLMWQGTAGLKFLYASSITLLAGLVMHLVYRRSGGVFWPALAVVALIAAGWQQFSIIRPQLAGLVCFGLLLHWTLTRSRRQADWILIPLLFVAWANLHGSFVVGLLVLAARAAGEFTDYLRGSRRFRLAFRAPAVVRSLLLLQLATVACLLNPYGLEIYRTVLTFSSHPNLINLVDWDPLTLRMIQGRTSAVLALAVVIALKSSPRRITATEFLLLVGLGGLALWTSRMLIWWIPVAACVLGIHGHAAWQSSALRRLLTRQSRSELRQRRWSAPASPARSLWTVAMLGIGFLAFSLSPLSMQLRAGQQQELADAVSSGTPITAAEYLQGMPDRPGGPVLNTFEWGDYLQWSCPELDVFVNSHVHLIPAEVWDHYIDISNGAAGTQGLLDRYGVNLVVLREGDSPRLARQLRENSSDWSEVYSDNQAAIFVRRQPI